MESYKNKIESVYNNPDKMELNLKEENSFYKNIEGDGDNGN
jgi:hypothetical protein